MQRRVTLPLVAPLAPFNARRFLVGSTFKPNPKPFLLAFCRAHGTLHCAEVLGCCVEGYQACNEEFVTLGCAPGTLQCAGVSGCCFEGSQACNEGSFYPWLHPWHPSMRRCFWLLLRRVPGMQRRVTLPLVAPLAPFNAQVFLVAALKGPRRATKGHFTLGCTPGTLQCAGVPSCCVEGSQACNEGSRYPWLHPWHPSMRRCFWLLRRRVPGMQRRVFVTLKP